MPLTIEKLDTVYEGYSTLYKATVRGPDGETFQREIEDHGQAVAVLPYDPDRKTALLVRLPRLPVIWAGGPSELLEAPAGMLDGDEPHEEAARREAMEEVGAQLGDMERVGAAFPSGGVSSEKVTLFLAPYGKSDRVEQGGGVEGEQENITVIEMPLGELWRQVEAQEIQDMKTLLLAHALRARRPELFEA